MGTVRSRWKKLHRWPGVIVSFLLLYYGITGIFMNHRQFFSGLDVDRSNLPDNFQYHHWNNSALKGNLIIHPDSIMVYGNIGIWVTDSTFENYRSLNAGFPYGADNRKIFDLHRTADGHLYAATQFGLYAFNTAEKQWVKFPLDVQISRFVAVQSINDTIYAINRSWLFKGKSAGIQTRFQKIELNEPVGYRNTVPLFLTIWQIHSGEIFGLPGQLFVDFLGLVTVFLSVTGLIYFFFPGWIKRRKRKSKKIQCQIQVNRWSLKWHNKIGAWFFIFLFILFFTGIFLRPPALIAVANAKISPVKYSKMDQPNPWYDKLRGLRFDEREKRWMLSTSEGMFHMNQGALTPVPFQIQPPVSVMGINALECTSDSAFLVGSFTGLFRWQPGHPDIYDYTNGKLYKGNPSGRPIGNYKVTGMITKPNGEQYLVDYDRGIIPLHHAPPFPKMPEQIITESRMSLWSLSLEIHTGRFFHFLLGDFYILLVPLVSLISAMVVISGYMVYRKKFKHKK